MIIVKHPIALVATFLWIGFVCAISFMESWLKFRAPGVSLPIGLGIGRMVFNTLNKVEWIFAIAIIGNYFLEKTSLRDGRMLLLSVPLILLIIQTFWLLPALDARAEFRIQSQEVASSNLHFYYVGIEVVKVICLAVFGISIFKNTTV